MAKEDSKAKGYEGPAGISLQAYVKQVCLEILTGVIDAQGDESLGKYVGRSPIRAEFKDEGGNSISYIDFDVAAEVVTSAEGTGGVSVFNFAKADGSLEKKRSDSNRVKFSVPIGIPSPEDQVGLREKLKNDRKEMNRKAAPSRTRKFPSRTSK